MHLERYIKTEWLGYGYKELTNSTHSLTSLELKPETELDAWIEYCGGNLISIAFEIRKSYLIKACVAGVGGPGRRVVN